MRRGFTLVELSIVLVIIGLLVGGILVAQSIISTVRVSSLVRQTQQFDVAVANFKSKYKTIPGDSLAFPPASLSLNNGNGHLDDNNTNNSGGAYTTGITSEASIFWQHLQIDGLINQPTFNLNWGDGVPLNQDMPKAVFGKAGAGPNSDFAAFVLPAYNSQSVYAHYYYFCAFRTGDGSGDAATNEMYYSYPAYTPAEALAIDKKMDDGITGQVSPLTYSGNVIASLPTSGNPLVTAASNCGSSGNPNQYNTSYNQPACCLFVRMQGAE